MIKMLIKYKSCYEKISMGLLAYMPEEKNVKKLQQTIKKYEEDPRFQLYLWKEQEDIIGILGVSLLEDGTAQLNHLSVNPSYREEGIGKKMIFAVKELYHEVVPSVQTTLFFAKCDALES
jgi:riboflavin biosynthesis RibT protein